MNIKNKINYLWEGLSLLCFILFNISSNIYGEDAKNFEYNIYEFNHIKGLPKYGGNLRIEGSMRYFDKTQKGFIQFTDVNYLKDKDTEVLNYSFDYMKDFKISFHFKDKTLSLKVDNYKDNVEAARKINIAYSILKLSSVNLKKEKLILNTQAEEIKKIKIDEIDEIDEVLLNGEKVNLQILNSDFKILKFKINENGELLLWGDMVLSDGSYKLTQKYFIDNTFIIGQNIEIIGSFSKELLPCFKRKTLDISTIKEKLRNNKITQISFNKLIIKK